ncbi:hypothetical protein Tco_0822253 [Tanacetum coccineum]|uniref:Uncharacterized protein n=1 Tax=Tanacetum coccineum TaxID=301880 RepID=A0ABQ5AGC1_9ASTR
MAWLPICGELRSASNSVHWEPMFIIYCNRSIGEDYRLGRAINCAAMEVDNVVNRTALFIEELDSLGVRHVLAKFAEFLKEIHAKDREIVANLQILVREMELNASLDELSIQGFSLIGCIVMVLMLLRLISYFVATEFLIATLTEQAESIYLKDKMKFWFTRARSEDQAFVVLMRAVCLELKIKIHKTQRLIAELEALGEVGDAVTSLNHMREIVGRESAKLAVLEQLSASTDVAMRLKDGYVTDME